MRRGARIHHAHQLNLRDTVLIGLIDLVQGLRIAVGGDYLLLRELSCDYRGVKEFSVRLRPGVRFQVNVRPRGEMIRLNHPHRFVQMQARSYADDLQ
jgi:hypothetical protein